MLPGRYLPIVAALLLGAMAVPAQAATFRSRWTDLVFAPAEVSAKVGDTIEWINKDVFAHTATARNGDFDVTIRRRKRDVGAEEGRYGRVLLPVSSEHEGSVSRIAACTCQLAMTAAQAARTELRNLLTSSLSRLLSLDSDFAAVRPARKPTRSRWRRAARR